ncbi:MAG: Hpt domain-containing protein [Rhodospirillales bacterium]|jgi:HPt (histidine-containing phosphotransfer) domain-containing protein|nr:Hpt domain-containing protein [Rhodospirillales bacterium]
MKNYVTPPIDLRAIEEILGDADVIAITEHIAMFISEFEALLQDLKAAMEQNNRQIIRDAAHAAKSASVYVGATGLSDLLRNIEKQAPETDFSLLKGSLPVIDEEFESIRVFYSAYANNV